MLNISAHSRHVTTEVSIYSVELLFFFFYSTQNEGTRGDKHAKTKWNSQNETQIKRRQTVTLESKRRK